MKQKKCDCMELCTLALLFIVLVLLLGIHYNDSESLITNISHISDAGLLVVAIISAIFACYEYMLHKNNEKTQLLCHYNQRYTTDENIKAVIQWMLANSVFDENGDIVGYVYKYESRNLLLEKEMFMRFFEELNIQLRNGNIDEEDVYHFFSYYALKFAIIKEFRSDITDYQKNWKHFRCFIVKMRKYQKRCKIDALDSMQPYLHDKEES